MKVQQYFFFVFIGQIFSGVAPISHSHPDERFDVLSLRQLRIPISYVTFGSEDNFHSCFFLQ